MKHSINHEKYIIQQFISPVSYLSTHARTSSSDHNVTYLQSSGARPVQILKHLMANLKSTKIRKLTCIYSLTQQDSFTNYQ